MEKIKNFLAWVSLLMGQLTEVLEGQFLQCDRMVWFPWQWGRQKEWERDEKSNFAKMEIYIWIAWTFELL